VGGLRRDHIDVERSIRVLNAGRFTRFGNKYDANAVRLGAVYDLAKDSTVYAQYTNAEAPVSSLFLLSSGNTAFPLSKGKQTEIGFKKSLDDKRFDWTAAVYKNGAGQRAQPRCHQPCCHRQQRQAVVTRRRAVGCLAAHRPVGAGW